VKRTIYQLICQDAHEAQDLTQGFFELYLAKHYLKDVDRRERPLSLVPARFA
jgi:hypothetical protein